MLIRKASKRTAAAVTCALALGTLSMAPAAMAGKPGPAPPPPPTTNATAYSGEAQVVDGRSEIVKPPKGGGPRR